MKGHLIRDKSATREQNPGAVRILNKDEFQKALVLKLVETAGLIQNGNNEQNVRLIAELETIIRHLAEINKIPVVAIENMFNTLSQKEGLYNAQLFIGNKEETQ